MHFQCSTQKRSWKYIMQVGLFYLLQPHHLVEKMSLPGEVAACGRHFQALGAGLAALPGLLWILLAAILNLSRNFSGRTGRPPALKMVDHCICCERHNELIPRPKGLGHPAVSGHDLLDVINMITRMSGGP